MSTLSKPQPQPVPRIFTRTFDDAYLTGKAVTFSNLTASQLTPGKLEAKFNWADLDSLKFLEVASNQGWRVKGQKSANRLSFTMTLTNSQTQILAHGCQISKQDLFGFDRTREVDMIVEKNTHIATANVDLNIFQSLAEQMGYDCLGSYFFQQNCIGFAPDIVNILRASYQQISQLLIHQTLLLMQPQMQLLIAEDFYPLLIDTLGKGVKQKRQKIKTYRRYSLVRQAEDIAQSYLDKPLTLKQLCDELETSSTALYYGFQDVFGMSPMAYIKTQRLNGVRRALKKANPETTMVMGVAQQWGFWSLNHFSRDYKKMFGELPSVTLRS